MEDFRIREMECDGKKVPEKYIVCFNDYISKVVNKCQNCTNRYICPTFEKDKCCMGYNDEELFASLLKMMFIGRDLDEFIAHKLKSIKELQNKKE